MRELSDAPKSHYICSEVAITKDIIDRVAAEWRSQRVREVGSPVRNALALIVGMSCIGAFVGLLPILAGQPYGAWAPVGFSVLGCAFAGLVALRIRKGSAQLEADISRLSARKAVKEHVLVIGNKHRFLPHEHGVMLLLPLDSKRSVVLDLSSAAGDLRAELVEAALRNDAVPREWSWLEIDDGVSANFLMTGEPVRPTVGDEGEDLDDEGFFQRAIDAMSEDGIVARFDFDAELGRLTIQS